ncbi:hypothetical protein PG987_009572 [Apiospora arundinis]
MPRDTPRRERDPYSTLEVSYPDPQDKTVVPVANEKIPDTSQDCNISNCTNGHAHSSNDQNGLEAVQENDTKGIPIYKRPRCGLSPLTFWALVVILNLLVLGAIGGGIAAAVLRRDYKSENANINSIPDPADGAGPPPQSQLSAVNWTDASNKDHKTVFYQRDGKLWLSQWDAGSVNWTHLDIESRLSPPAAREKSVALNPRTNTPLASVVAPAAPDGAERAILSTGGSLFWADGRNWSNATRILSALSATSLAMFSAPFRDASSGKQDDSRRTQARHMYHRDRRIDEYIFNDKVAFGWNPGTTGIIGNVPNTQRSPGLAAAAAIDNARGLVLALRADGVGNLTSSYLPATGLWDANQPKIPKHRNLVTSFDADENGGAVVVVLPGPPRTDQAESRRSRPSRSRPTICCTRCRGTIPASGSGPGPTPGRIHFRFTERVL